MQVDLNLWTSSVLQREDTECIHTHTCTTVHPLLLKLHMRGQGQCGCADFSINACMHTVHIKQGNQSGESPNIYLGVKVQCIEAQ